LRLCANKTARSPDTDAMRAFQKINALTCIIFLSGCAATTSINPTVTPGNLANTALSQTLVPALLETPTLTRTESPTETSTPIATPTEKPLTLIFYGDSVLKVGDVNAQGEVGYSIIEPLRADLNPADQIIISNHGGRKAQWGYENLEKNILVYSPDIVTLWWGMNDLGGCPGIFDRETNKILQYELDAMLALHLKYMMLQIDAFLGRNIPVLVITPIPILGTLPWSHFGPDNQLIWENENRCDFNTGLEQLVKAQRNMVSEYLTEKKPVRLVDAWQIYEDHPNSDNMYMDIVHPGSYGAQLIAAAWLQVFRSMKK
jgi:lysophospholipase L1-like esterase